MRRTKKMGGGQEGGRPVTAHVSSSTLRAQRAWRAACAIAGEQISNPSRPPKARSPNSWRPGRLTFHEPPLGGKHAAGSVGIGFLQDPPTRFSLCKARLKL
eukprot:1731113-Pyramimonas_sp.AAC.1